MTKSHLTPTISRLHKVASQVQEDLLQQAIQKVLMRHGLTVDTIGKPLLSYSDVAHVSPHTGRLCCGSAGVDQITLYAPGLIARETSGGDYELVTLNTFVHERTHHLCGEIKLPTRTTRINGIEVSSYTRVAGYQITFYTEMSESFLDRLIGAQSYSFFNEGVTESFAREVMDVYLRLDPTFAGIDRARVAKYRKELRSKDTQQLYAFYPHAVEFVRTFAHALARESGDLPGEWAGLYADYFKCTNLHLDRSWQERFHTYGITDVMKKVAGSQYIDMQLYTSKLRHVHDLRIVSDKVGLWSAIETSLE